MCGVPQQLILGDKLCLTQAEGDTVCDHLRSTAQRHALCLCSNHGTEQTAPFPLAWPGDANRTAPGIPACFCKAICNQPGMRQW